MISSVSMLSYGRAGMNCSWWTADGLRLPVPYWLKYFQGLNNNRPYLATFYSSCGCTWHWDCSPSRSHHSIWHSPSQTSTYMSNSGPRDKSDPQDNFTFVLELATGYCKYQNALLVCQSRAASIFWWHSLTTTSYQLPWANWIQPFQKMAKLKIENRSFQDRWEADYLFMNVKDLCRVCRANVAVTKEYNKRRHYETKTPRQMQGPGHKAEAPEDRDVWFHCRKCS